MYKEDQRFDRPDDKAKIWRYMDLAKLVWMLDKQCLYFWNIARLAEADRFEASYLPMGFLKELPSDAAKNFADKMKSCGPPLTVNCWHLNNFESAAMWKLY